LIAALYDSNAMRGSPSADQVCDGALRQVRSHSRGGSPDRLAPLRAYTFRFLLSLLSLGGYFQF